MARLIEQPMKETMEVVSMLKKINKPDERTIFLSELLIFSIGVLRGLHGNEFVKGYLQKEINNEGTTIKMKDNLG